MRLTGVSTGNLIEAGLGSVWGEDPRYFRSQAQGCRPRVAYVVKTAFPAPHRMGDGIRRTARFAGNVGNNFLSNTGRADSEANARDALVRCVWGVLGAHGQRWVRRVLAGPAEESVSEVREGLCQRDTEVAGAGPQRIGGGLWVAADRPRGLKPAFFFTVADPAKAACFPIRRGDEWYAHFTARMDHSRFF